MSSSSLVPGGGVAINREILNHAARKLSSISESDISFLSDDAIVSLLNAEFSDKSKDDLERIFEAEFSFFDAAIQSLLPSIFEGFLRSIFPPPPPPPPIPENQKYKYEYKQSNLDKVRDVGILLCLATSLIILGKCLHKIIPPYIIITTTDIAHQEERTKHSKRSKFLSKYSTTPDLKGLKCIGQTYIRQNNTSTKQLIQESVLNGESFSLLANETVKNEPDLGKRSLRFGEEKFAVKLIKERFN